MRPASPRYPVDRYLVKSSKKFEFVNILDDEIWHPEPALRPEDEIILRKLHEMLQSTADDLKALSGELSKFHNPGVQIKTQPMPLDEEFNEKVHVEEVVNAKFHGYKIIERPSAALILPLKKTELTPTAIKFTEPVTNVVKPAMKTNKVNTGVQVNAEATKTTIKNKNLSITRTKCVQITSENDNKSTMNDFKLRDKPSVSYNEFTFKYEHPITVIEKCKKLQIQDMPSINIRTELKEQKVLQLDIYPQENDKTDTTKNNTNVAVISIDHDAVEFNKLVASEPALKQHKSSNINAVKPPPIRKVSKMSVCDSSSSANPSSDTVQKFKVTQSIKSVLKRSPKTSARNNFKNSGDKKKETQKKLRLEEWRKKLNSIYGTSTSKISKTKTKSAKKMTFESKDKSIPLNDKSKHNLNNALYIPYNKLTLGGARVSDIEKEISNIPNNGNVRLSPVLDKILSSREDSSGKNHTNKILKIKDGPKILTTSDENLLEEVLNIEKNLSETISKHEKSLKNNSDDNNSDKIEIYDDDFEDEKTEVPPDDEGELSNEESDNNVTSKSLIAENLTNTSLKDKNIPSTNHTTKPDRTFTVPNLALKNSVEIFEFIHAVDTQDNATQSNTTHKISPKETQTSPRHDKPRPLQPIHNDLWPSDEPKMESFDPKGELEKLFKVEKDLIRKIIIEEYGDLLQKPSSSKDIKTVERDKNIYSNQKITQTSPALVKCVMTSPTRTKTRTTSPFLSVAVDHQTSPMIFVSNENAINISLEDEADGISINLSSPRFSLKLPQSSSDVLSNLDCRSATQESKDKEENKNTTYSKRTSAKSKLNHSTHRTNSKMDQATNTYYNKGRYNSSSSSSADVEKSSSEISSLGEVKLKLKRKNKKLRVPRSLESCSSSNSSKTDTSVTGGIVPLKSEGEISQGQNNSRKMKSEGEVSLEPFL